MSNSFFSEGTFESIQPSKLLDVQEPDVLHESVDAIRRDLSAFIPEKPNGVDLESRSVIPSVRMFDSCDGQCKDEPHFAKGAELLNSADAIGVQLGSIAMPFAGDQYLMDGTKLDAQRPDPWKGFKKEAVRPESKEERQFRMELARWSLCETLQLFGSVSGVCVMPVPPPRGYDYQGYHRGSNPYGTDYYHQGYHRGYNPYGTDFYHQRYRDSHTSRDRQG